MSSSFCSDYVVYPGNIFHTPPNSTQYHQSFRGQYEITEPEDYKRKIKHNDKSYLRTRSAANLRERRRMQCINEAFEGLRSHIPTLPYEKRLSKVDTLRLAICYINFLTDLVSSDEEQTDSNGMKIPQVPKQGKIIIYNSSKGEMDTNLPPLRGHSLSCFGGISNPKSKFIKTKQIWLPEDPNNNNLSTNSMNYS